MFFQSVWYVLNWFSGQDLFTAHRGNSNVLVKPTRQAANWGRPLCVSVCVRVCNRKVMSGGNDWLLPPSVPTFKRMERRKEEREREKDERPHGLGCIFCSLF